MGIWYQKKSSIPTITSRWVQKRDWGLACGKLKKSLTWPIQLIHTDAKNKAFVDTGFLKLSAGTMTGPIYLPSSSTVNTSQALNVVIASKFYVEIRNPQVNTRFYMVNHKIINLGDSNDDKDAI